LHFNIKNIVISNGFGSKEQYKNVYINLYNSIKKAIVNRTLDENIKLPPSRVLAKDLEISRSTVIKAYDLLVLEKYIKAVPGSGYYVSSIKNTKIYFNLTATNRRKDYPAISKKGLAFQRNIHLINSAQSNRKIAFKPGLPPLDIFPTNKWKNLMNTYWGTIKSSELSYSKTIGLKSLRKNISNYLKIYRNVSCDPDQIIITTGSLHSLYLIGNVLIDKGDKVFMENLTYPHAYRLFNSLQAKVTPVNLNTQENSIENLQSKKAKFFYTIPSNQYYSGIKMSMKKRLDLLQWASVNGSLLIEDDYEHEFSNWENPIASIYSLDKQDRVIYLGTFNKLLHPSIRLGYMIVPAYLKKAIIGVYQQSSRFVSTELQKVMNMFIEKDYLNKHIRNVIEIAQERKEIFIDHFNSSFENEISLDTNTTGLNIIGRFHQDMINDKEVATFIKKNGITTNPLSKYYITEPEENGLVMGYSCVNNKLIKESIDKMSQAYFDFLEFHNSLSKQ